MPEQILPNKEKTAKWAENFALSIYQVSQTQGDIHERIRFCYNFYQGNINQTDYDYLRKSGDYEYPALVRHIPLLKTMFKNLKSREIKRPFSFRTFVTDSESISRKKESYKQSVLDFLHQKAQKRIDMVLAALDTIEQLQAQIQHAAQEGQQPDPVIIRQMQQAKEILNNKSFLDKEEVKKLERYYKLEYKDILEILSEKGLRYLYRKKELANKFNSGFEDVIVSECEFYFVDYNESYTDPEFELMDPCHFYHSADDVDWVKDCQWAYYEKMCSLNNLVDRVPDIDPIKLKELEDRCGRFFNHAWFNSVTGYRSDGYGYNDYSASNALTGSNVLLGYIFWQSPVKVYFYSVINKNGKYEEKFTLDLKEIPKDGEYETRYCNEVWEALVADRDIVLYARKRKLQIYDSNYRNLGLPFAGQNKWGRKKGNSMVWETKDLQTMYNLVHYHKELWLALSGVKGFIMDKSQIPDDMSPEEWMYQRKMGVAWIETVKKNKRVNTTFNQFQHYDDTVTASIQYLLKILEHYERLASYVTGVSQQSMGMIVPTDQVGTTESSIQQSELTNEILFIDHEMTKRHALMMLINTARVLWHKDGKEDQYVEDDMTQSILTIPKNTLGNGDYDIAVIDGSKEKENRQVLRQLVMNGQQKNLFDIPASAKMLLTENTKELESLLDYYSDIALERATSSAQQQQQSEMAAKEMDNKMKLLMAQQTEKTKLASLQIDKSRLEFDVKKHEAEMELEKKKLEADIAVKKLDINSERQIENMYLEFEKKKAVYDTYINQMKLQLDSVNMHIDRLVKLTEIKHKEKIKD